MFFKFLKVILLIVIGIMFDVLIYVLVIKVLLCVKVWEMFFKDVLVCLVSVVLVCFNLCGVVCFSLGCFLLIDFILLFK